MYSRKFNGIHSLPPDYSGVALRQDGIKGQRLPDTPQKTEDINDTYGTYPKYPVYEDDGCPQPDFSPPKDHSSGHNLQKNHNTSQNQAITKGSDTVEKPKGLFSSFSNKSFSLEDIVLAGIILLVMNEDERDDGLLLILGFLLLIGMK